jgi:hypothetical protein
MLKHMIPAVAALALAASTAAAQMPAQPAAGPGLSLVLRDGLVTLRAEQASLRQILAEWERQGQVKFVGIDKLVSGAPVTLSLTDMPEKQALDIVMRGVPGYMAVDRAARVETQTASRYDRVIVMARATTPVAAAAGPATGLNRAMPSPAQPAEGFQQTMPEAFVQPVQADEQATPDRADVEQFSQAEPAMPEAPVVSPYPNAFPGSPYAGAANGTGPYGGSPNAAAAAGMNTAAPPETQFDYANPQKYFEQRRQQMQGPTATPGLTPIVPVGGQPIVGTTGRPQMPTGVPTATGTLAQPGVAPTPQPNTPPQGQFFNPYNLPPDWVPPPPVPDTGTPVEPDRAKYSNPYQPNPPQE